MSKKRTNTSEIVYKAIEEKIINQEWVAGTKITSEVQLATELGVSRMSVREAIEKMVALSILTKKQGEGTFVNELSPSMYINGLIPMMLLNKDNLLDVLEFRVVIEGNSAALCAQRCTDDTIAALEKCYQTMCDTSDNSEAFSIADYQFHMEIAKGTMNSLVIKVNSILTDIWKHQQKELNKYLGPSKGLEEHRKILDAIKSKDEELARLFMTRHVSRTLSDIVRIKLDQ